MIIEKLNKNHKKERFDCGNEVLNIFLKKYAYQNQNRYLVGVTYVLHKENLIYGYITISVSSIKKSQVLFKKPYEDIPILRIARLAVDIKFQNNGLGKELLKFAINKAIELKNNFGCVGIVVDAKEQAIDFYKKFGFIEIKTFDKHLTSFLYLSIKTIEKIYKDKND